MRREREKGGRKKEIKIMKEKTELLREKEQIKPGQKVLDMTRQQSMEAAMCAVLGSTV